MTNAEKQDYLLVKEALINDEVYKFTLWDGFSSFPNDVRRLGENWMAADYVSRSLNTPMSPSTSYYNLRRIENLEFLNADRPIAILTDSHNRWLRITDPTEFEEQETVLRRKLFEYMQQTPFSDNNN